MNSASQLRGFAVPAQLLSGWNAQLRRGRWVDYGVPTGGGESVAGGPSHQYFGGCGDGP